MAMCSLQRAQFVSNCDCIMGRSVVRKFSEKILRDGPVVTIELEHDNHHNEYVQLLVFIRLKIFVSMVILAGKLSIHPKNNLRVFSVY